MTRVLGIGFAASFAGAAAGQVTAFDVEHIVSDDGSRIANVLSIDFDGLYQGTQLVVELTEGAIINETLFGSPNDSPPPEGRLNFFPEFAFDTYAAQGDRFAAGNVGGLNIGGAAVNILPMDTEVRWDQTQRLSRAWNDVGSPDILEGTHFVVAQLGLTSDAQGEFIFFTAVADNFFQTGIDTVTYRIENGKVVPVPEPGMLGALGVLGWLGLRRR
ncbi:MAG: PEP-CTERM sorting domain-containing protein [Planctomycetota bacterium]